jgi:hypothetical protein
MKKPFLHAVGATLYIVFIVFVIQGASYLLKGANGTLVIPMTMLSLFVLSAAVMGYLFLSEPLKLLIESKKQEAVTFFVKTVGFFACFVAVFGISLLLISYRNVTPSLDVRLNINVICDNSLSYMSFPDAESANKFVAECKDGKHPEVVEHYKSQLPLAD